jgi:hypothetical protein
VELLGVLNVRQTNSGTDGTQFPVRHFHRLNISVPHIQTSEDFPSNMRSTDDVEA